MYEALAEIPLEILLANRRGCDAIWRRQTDALWFFFTTHWRTILDAPTAISVLSCKNFRDDLLVRQVEVDRW
jgi:hypothetical protein